MKQNTNSDDKTFNRRDFLKGGSIASMISLLGGIEIKAQPAAAPAADAKETGPAVKCAVIGLGYWGRDVVATLTRLPGAKVTAICDNYGASLRRSAKGAPEAAQVEDYRKILDDKEIQAVVVATPTHLHKEIVLAALQAGKHVYCEAPLATTIEDARAIARAAKATPKVVFQSGLQMRSDPQRHFLLQFIRAGAMGRPMMARAQWNKKQSWRYTSPNQEREKDINWRLRNETSTGLIGEVGIHQIDMASLFLMGQPAAVTGFGSVMHWRDGRNVPDTIQALFEFPGGVNMIYHATLANSFDADYEMYHGTDSAVMIRGNKAWMFKEVDSPLLGWEVYARKDLFYKETGIALVANATKLVAQGANPVEDAPYTNTPLFYALESFLHNVREVSTGVEDFTASFANATNEALVEYLSGIKRLPAADYKEGFDATVIAIKANEAITKGQKVTFQKEWFEI